LFLFLSFSKDNPLATTKHHEIDKSLFEKREQDDDSVKKKVKRKKGDK
jgi:hypothetical protein